MPGPRERKTYGTQRTLKNYPFQNTEAELFAAWREAAVRPNTEYRPNDIFVHVESENGEIIDLSLKQSDRPNSVLR